jgi:hypothetical protein
MKRSKQRTRNSSIPLFLTTRFCTSVAPPPPPLLCLCLCVSLHTTDFCQTVFRTHFRHTSNHFLLLLLRTASSAQNPKHSRIEETTAMRIETAKRETKRVWLLQTQQLTRLIAQHEAPGDRR